jgi:ABC-type multidrug transport system ATPase subunit
MPLLELRNVTVRYGRTTALSNLSLGIPRGEITAIIGPSGAARRRFSRS